MSVEWNKSLSVKVGGLVRLGGLKIYYDFDWDEMFTHSSAQFPGGQSLAQAVKKDCPDGLRPCLLLTDQQEERPPIVTASEYIVVIPIEDYLDNHTADAASTYFATHSPAPLTQLSKLSDEVHPEGELGLFLDKQLTPQALADWLARSPARVKITRELVASDTSPAPVNIATALQNLSVEDPSILQEFANYLERVGTGGQLRTLFTLATEREGGRAAAVEALAGRLSERISDVRSQLTNYETLIANPASTETDVQRFLEGHPWIVGLPYVRARARVPITRGALDFVLDRYDGFFDIVELKGPRERIVIEPLLPQGDRPASASSYSLGPALAGALAQAHHYRALLAPLTAELREQYGLADTRQPQILIVLGTSVGLSNTAREILRQLNLSLHRVEIIPYDLLGRRTASYLDNLEELLGLTRNESLHST